MLPGDWDFAHAIRLGIKPFAELGANSEELSGSQVDSPCSCRAIFESAPVAMLQSPFSWDCCLRATLGALRSGAMRPSQRSRSDEVAAWRHAKPTSAMKRPGNRSVW